MTVPQCIMSVSTSVTQVAVDHESNGYLFNVRTTPSCLVMYITYTVLVCPGLSLSLLDSCLNLNPFSEAHLTHAPLIISPPNPVGNDRLSFTKQ